MPKCHDQSHAAHPENSHHFQREPPQRALRLAACLSCALAAISCGAPARLMPTNGYALELGRKHPLSGRVYASAGRDFSTAAQLTAALAAAQYVVLGETHDNVDHHRLQAQLVAQFLDQHAAAQVGFEMLDETDAPALADPEVRTPDELAARVHWDESGWPAFTMYRPIFAAAFAHHAQLLAAHPSGEHVHESMHGLPEEEARSLQLDQPLPDPQLAAERDEIRESHCGHANDAMITAMQRAQVYKDAFMARALVQSQHPVVLIAGRGHARNDRAVPYFLRRFGAKHVLSVAFVEVADDRPSPTDYDVQAFDFVVFTPRVSDEDPCEAFRKQLEQMHQGNADKAGS